MKRNLVGKIKANLGGKGKLANKLHHAQLYVTIIKLFWDFGISIADIACTLHYA